MCLWHIFVLYQNKYVSDVDDFVLIGMVFIRAAFKHFQICKKTKTKKEELR